MILSGAEIEELREALQEERKSVELELVSYGERDESGRWSGSSESVGEEADPSDVADNIEELATNAPLVRELSERLHDIDDALKKIKKSDYGTCEVGGEEIPFGRLQANPAARTCIAHAQ